MLSATGDAHSLTARGHRLLQHFTPAPWDWWAAMGALATPTALALLTANQLPWLVAPHLQAPWDLLNLAMLALGNYLNGAPVICDSSPPPQIDAAPELARCSSTLIFTFEQKLGPLTTSLTINGGFLLAEGSTICGCSEAAIVAGPGVFLFQLFLRGPSEVFIPPIKPTVNLHCEQLCYSWCGWWGKAWRK